MTNIKDILDTMELINKQLKENEDIEVIIKELEELNKRIKGE